MKVESERPVEMNGRESRLQTGAPGALQRNANWEFPATGQANAATRDEFRLNTFPPDNHAPPAPLAPQQPDLSAKP